MSFGEYLGTRGPGCIIMGRILEGALEQGGPSLLATKVGKKNI